MFAQHPSPCKDDNDNDNDDDNDDIDNDKMKNNKQLVISSIIISMNTHLLTIRRQQ